MSGRIQPVALRNVKVDDAYWAPRIRTNKEEAIPHQWAIFNDEAPEVARTHAIANFRIVAGDIKGEHAGLLWQDSDVAKWLEGVGHTLAIEPDPELEALADGLIDLIVRAQDKDGYLNTYYQLAKPKERWSWLEGGHELYCCGHMIEAAIAYYHATGKRKLLDAMCRFADHIADRFGRDPGQVPGFPGHPEIELALVALFRTTGERRYLELSRYFVDERGRTPHWFDIEAKARGENPHPSNHINLQAHVPLREQKTAEGHAVRALYLYSGALDVAAETGDQELIDVCKTLWNNIVSRRMYVTGGVGADANGERFSFDYHLPNDRAYAETCANIALVLFAHRWLQLDIDRTYGDVMELALYNSVLSGVSLDGKHYFYTNPLAVTHDSRDLSVSRPPWQYCACCPTNIVRFLPSLGRYIYAKGELQGDETLYVHLYVGGEAEFGLGATRVRLVQETRYPWDEYVKIKVHPDRSATFALALRLPGWCRHPELKVNHQQVPLEQVTEKGYATIRRRWNPGDEVELVLPMRPERLEAHPRIGADAGMVAIRRGPIVYCLEEADNGCNISAVSLPRESELRAEWDPDLLGGVMVIKGTGRRTSDSSWGEALYRPVDGPPVSAPIEITAVPYYAWANRKPGEMAVWIRDV